MSLIASFLDKTRRIYIDGEPHIITVMYADDSAFVARDADNRIVVVRSILNRWTVNKRPVVIETEPPRSFDQLLQEARSSLAARGLWTEPWGNS